jgi:hypothetical protein
MNIHSQRFVQLFFYDHDRDLWWLAKKYIVAQVFCVSQQGCAFLLLQKFGSVSAKKNELALLGGSKAGLWNGN